MVDWEYWEETGVNWEGTGRELGILAALEGVYWEGTRAELGILGWNWRDWWGQLGMQGRNWCSQFRQDWPYWEHWEGPTHLGRPGSCRRHGHRPAPPGG